MDETLASRLRAVYEDLHANPELSGAEHRTAKIAADWLRECGYEVHERIGGTGVVGVLRRGEGPVVLLRADMDALPMTEQTGLSYSSTVEGVMHACGHDMHTTCLMGAAYELAGEDAGWSGTLIALFQPAEETVSGARAMVEDGLYDKVPRPDIVLGQHVAPVPAGVLALQPGPSFAGSDVLEVTMYGEGGHGSRPEAAIDPILMAASAVQRLQGIVSRETAGADTVVVTVGAFHAGTKSNIIPDQAELSLSVRTFSEESRVKTIAAIERILNAEAQASGAKRPPLIETTESTPVLVNDPDACAATLPVLQGTEGVAMVVEPGPATGSEDVGILATAAGVPIVYWILGGADPEPFAGAASLEEFQAIVANLPANHSPFYHPVPEPTIQVGVAALCAAARHWLD